MPAAQVAAVLGRAAEPARCEAWCWTISEALPNSLGLTGALLLNPDTQVLLSWHGEARTAQGVAQLQGHGKMEKQVCYLLSTTVTGQEGCSARQYPT